MACIANHVRRRGAVYHFRCRVPADLLQFLRKRELRCSLHTTDPGAAKARAARLYVRLREAFEEIRAM